MFLQTLSTLILLSTGTHTDQPPAKQQPEKADQLTDEDRKFQGTWTVVCEVTRGQPQYLSDILWTFTGKRYVVMHRDKLIEAGTQHLDPSKRPKEMVESVTEGSLPGRRDFAYYEINGDACTIYFPKVEKGPRPTSLVPTPKEGFVVKLRRTKPPGPVAHADANPDSAEKNAAVHYQRALDLIPGLDDLFEHESKLLEDWQTAPLDDTTRAILDRCEPALRYLRHAAACPTCQWNRLDDLKKHGPASTVSINVLVPARTLFNATCLRARYLASQGKTADAVNELLTFLPFARRLDGTEVMVLKLAAIALERIALQQLAMHAATLKDANVLRTKLRHYDALPPAATLADVMRGESIWWIVWLARANLPQTGPEQLNEWANLHEDAARITLLPHADRPAAVKELAARVEAARPRLGQLATGLDPTPLFSVEDLITAERLLFRAGLAVLIGGPDELQTSKDPFSGQPFQYRPLIAGFELSSALKDKNGQHIKLLFGQPMKK